MSPERVSGTYGLGATTSEMLGFVLTHAESVWLVVATGVMCIGSGAFGLAARQKVSGTITARHAFGPGFRIATGVALFIFLAVAR